MTLPPETARRSAAAAGRLLAALLAAAALLPAPPASAQQSSVLICEDAAASGFLWRDGKWVGHDFPPARFTVRLERGNKRLIKLPGDDGEVEYRCAKLSYSKTACTQAETAAYSPIVFEEERFERVHNFSPHGAFRLYVAHGSCSPL